MAPLRATRGSSNGAASYNYNIHGRHVEVTPELEEYVKSKFSVTLEKLATADYLEAEGGVQEVDIRLMCGT
jgi:ribosome-associated translation inhibitor RaiA